MTATGYSVVVLGSGQDGAVPQLGAPPVAGPGRTASSVALVGDDGACALIDVSPDVRSQQRMLSAFPEYAVRTDEAAFDALALTHAHVGHYAGLVHFGVEAHNVRDLPVFATPAMLSFLSANEPWAGLFAAGHLAARPLPAGRAATLLPGVTVVAHAVPHRPDHSDNVAFELRGPSGRSLLYAPDLDRWSDWPGAADVLRRVDIALVDGTFFSVDEHPTRDLTAVPHPAVIDTIRRFSSIAHATRLILTHLNWTNPLCDPTAPEHAAVRAAGFEVAVDGLRLPL